MTIELNGYYTLILATLVLLLGRFLVVKVKFLSNFNIPEPVEGGLVSAQSIADAGNSGHAELIAVGRDAIINPDFALKIAAGRENELADSFDGPLGAQAQHIPDVLWGVLLGMQPWVPIRGLK